MLSTRQSNGATPSGPNTWARLFDLPRDESASEMVTMRVCVRVLELATEAVSGQPRTVKTPAPVTASTTEQEPERSE